MVIWVPVIYTVNYTVYIVEIQALRKVGHGVCQSLNNSLAAYLHSHLLSWHWFTVGEKGLWLCWQLRCILIYLTWSLLCIFHQSFHWSKKCLTDSEGTLPKQRKHQPIILNLVNRQTCTSTSLYLQDGALKCCKCTSPDITLPCSKTCTNLQFLPSPIQQHPSGPILGHGIFPALKGVFHAVEIIQSWRFCTTGTEVPVVQNLQVLNAGRAARQPSLNNRGVGGRIQGVR